MTIPILIFLFVIAAIVFVLKGIFDVSKVSAKKALSLGGIKFKKIRVLSIVSIFFPFTSNILEKLKLTAKIKDRLDAGHVMLTAADFFNIKFILMLGLAGLSILIFGKKADLLIIALIVAVGYVIPDFWLSRKINQRKYKIVRRLPETVDLLGLCVEGGLDFSSAVRWIIDKTTPTPLVEELAFVLEEIKWGKSRTQALKDMAKRLNIPEVSSFVQTLVQSERMGTSIAEAFAILSEDARLQRFHQGERYAVQAPIKILIPLIFCILPVIAIIIGGPIVLQFMQGEAIFKGFGH